MTDDQLNALHRVVHGRATDADLDVLRPLVADWSPTDVDPPALPQPDPEPTP